MNHPVYPPAGDLYYYQGGEMFVEKVKASRLAEIYGTPLYVYSYAVLTRTAREITEAFRALNGLVCYSFKANSNRTLAMIVSRLGYGVDVVSGGEYHRALAAGFEPGLIIFAGVGKTEQEIGDALENGLLFFNVESAAELRSIEKIAGTKGVKAPVSLRINPDIDPETHPYISTGLKTSKFGIPVKEAVELYTRAAESRWLVVKGASCHIGSNILSVEPFAAAFKILLATADSLASKGIEMEYLDFGGGLGVNYTGEKAPSPRELAGAIAGLLAGKSYRVIFEPGRAVVAQAGILLSRVILTKGREKRFVIIDAGMNDFLRPSLYGAEHAVKPVKTRAGAKIIADIAGPICESGDVVARELEIVEPKPGELLAIFGTGAYGFIMASNYNSRPRPAEVLVRGDKHYLINRRETLDDLVKNEVVPPFLGLPGPPE